MIYLCVYLIIIICTFFGKHFVLKGKKLDNFFLVIISMILILISSCRFQADESDFATNYFRMIEVKEMSWNDVVHYNGALLHQIFRKIIAIFFDSPQWYFFFSALIIVGGYAVFLKNFSSDIYLSLFLFYTIFIYFTSHNVTRQCVAVAVTFIAFKYVCERKLLRFCLVMIMALLIHVSSIVFIPMYFLANIEFSKKIIKWYLFFVVGVIVLQNIIFAIIQKFIFGSYINNAYGTGTSNIFLLVIPMFCSIVLIMTSREREKSILGQWDKRKADYINNVVNHGTFLYVLCSILSYTKMLMMSRVALYFAAPTILLLLYSSKYKDRKSCCVKYGCYIIGSLWFLAMLISGNLIPTPYKTFWSVL